MAVTSEGENHDLVDTVSAGPMRESGNALVRQELGLRIDPVLRRLTPRKRVISS